MNIYLGSLEEMLKVLELHDVAALHEIRSSTKALSRFEDVVALWVDSMLIGA